MHGVEARVEPESPESGYAKQVHARIVDSLKVPEHNTFPRPSRGAPRRTGARSWERGAGFWELGSDAGKDPQRGTWLPSKRGPVL